VPDDEKALVKLAKKMKKNNVSIDFVAFGEIEDDVTKKLQAFNENVKSGDGSHLAIIPPGPGLLSDQLITTPIMNGDGSAAPGAGGGGGGNTEDFEFGIDPSVDPEMALALRMSMEEEKARLERVKKQEEEEAKKKALESVKEEGGESEPLLDKNGDASGSGDKKNEDPDKMDTA
jgi:26S proteasome regulatory subunit N10